MATTTSTLDTVKIIVGRTLGITERVGDWDTSTPLFGAVPELDSLAVVELAAAIEDAFGFQIEDSDFTADVFETIGSLAAFIDANRP